MKYYSKFPFSKVNELSNIDNNDNYYKVYDQIIVDHNVQIVEKIFEGKLLKLTYIPTSNINLTTIHEFHLKTYDKIQFEIEEKMSNNVSCLKGFYPNHPKEFYILIRKYDDQGNIICETINENGILLEYSEYGYSKDGKILYHDTFLGENAWVIEKHKNE